MIEFIKCAYLITYNIISNTIKSILNMVIKIGKSLVVDGNTLSWWDGKKNISTSYGRGNVNIQIGNCSVTSGDPVVNISVEGDAGDIPEFDKEFNILDDYEHPQFLLFKDGERTPRLHTSADDIVFVVFIET